MKIIISEIPAEGLELDVREAITSSSFTLIRNVEGHLRFSLHNGELSVQGRVATASEVQCSRCLATFPLVMDVPVDLVYYPSVRAGREDHVELHPDELDVSYYAGDEIRTEDILEEQILLNMPMKPLCKSDCRGICPSCGADLNVRECACRPRTDDSVFSVLRNLKKDKE